MNLRFTVLGCGSSPGVPRIHGDWGACDPANPKNRRSRCSLLVELAGRNGTTNVVVDTSPDFREQMLSAGVGHVDAVLFTHPHADHIHGIDDLRGYALIQGKKIPTFADRHTSDRLMEGFRYCYETPAGSFYPPILDLNEIEAGTPFVVTGAGGELSVLPVLQEHGNIQSLGFRFGSNAEGEGGLCYSPDISGIPAQSVEHLRGLDVWIVDALQYREHVSHFSLGQALEWIERLEPRRAVLTHMHIPLDFETVRRETPDHVEPAFDGMCIEVPLKQ